MFNKNLIEELFNIFKEHQIEYITAVLKNLKRIFEYQISIDNDEFFLNFIKNFDTIQNELYQIKVWRLLSDALNAIELILENLHKYMNSNLSTSSNVNNINNNNNIAEDFSAKILNFIKFFINYDNYQIQTIAIGLLAKNLKYCRNKEEIIAYTKTEFFDVKSFYKRRLYIIFFHKLLKIFSINYLKEIGILENIFDFFDDTSINICQMISILPDFYPLISDMSDLRFKLLNKLSDLRKNEKYIGDKEINRVKYNLF